MDEDMALYFDIEQIVKQNGLESGNNKPFWKYVKSQKIETFGISSLKSSGKVITECLSKAEVVNSKFKSVFTPHSGKNIPPVACSSMSQDMSENGVFMLLDRIDVSKSSGPDKLLGRMLQCLAKEIPPVVNYLLNGYKLMLHIFLRKAVSYRQWITILYLWHVLHTNYLSTLFVSTFWHL